MGDVVDLVSSALRRKLLDHGARSLSEAEWNLLRIAHLLNSIEDATFDRLLADSPLAELLALADGLDAIQIALAAVGEAGEQRLERCFARHAKLGGGLGGAVAIAIDAEDFCALAGEVQ